MAQTKEKVNKKGMCKYFEINCKIFNAYKTWLVMFKKWLS